MWRSEFRLRMHDIDGLGHLTATSYLGLFEETRAAWMTESHNMVYPTYVVATQRIDYLREVTRADGPVTVTLAIEQLRTSSVHVAEQLAAAGIVRARSSAVLVMWDMQRRASRPITGAERAVFERYLTTPA